MKFPPWLDVYGDLAFRGKCPTETLEQVTFFNRIRQTKWGTICLHPRNEGNRTHHQTAKQKAEGMTPGASDIIIPGAPTFVCELKRQDHTQSQWEPGQLEYLETAKNAGAFVCVGLGVEGAWEAFLLWSGA